MASRKYGELQLRTNSKLKFFESSGANFVSLKGPASIAADFEFILPGNDVANGAMVSNGSGTLSIALIANANISGSAAIAYSKLALSDSIVNADINSAAAIAYSKLNLSGSIVNADVNASAAIAYSKLAALTADRALQSDGSGFVSASSVTNTELGYVSGVTSSIQTQFSGKASTALSNLASVAINTSLVSDTDNTDDLGSSAITWRYGYFKSGLRLQETGAGTDAITISAPAALAAPYSLVLPVDDGASGEVLSTNGSGVLSWVSNASSSSFAADWITADGATKTITHSLGSSDVIVQIYDKADNATIEVDSVVRTDANTVDVTASEAPNASGWRVMILKI